MKSLILLLFIGLNTATPESYYVETGGHRIGDLNAEILHQEDKTIYQVSSKVEAHIFGKISVHYTLRSEFQGGYLRKSQVKVYNGDELHNSCSVVWKGDHYDIITDGEKSRINKKITSSTAQMYFKKPSAQNEIFSEFDGVFKHLEQEGSLFTVSKKDGSHKTLYRYTGDSMTETSSHHAMLTFYVRKGN